MSRRRSLAVAVLVSGAAAALPSVAPAEAANRQLGARTLSQGLRGRDVRILQDFLTRAGVPTPVDGRFGSGTRRKLREWESRHAPAAGATASGAGVRVDGRLNRAEAAVLRSEVESAEAGQAPAPAPAAPVAPPTEAATLGPDGSAVAPASAPDVVKRLVAAGNEIRDMPYKYGGGHGTRVDSGYDCSGSMSYAFQGAGLLVTALDSSAFASWGQDGPGQWVTIYANAGHSYMVVAGLRFDTSGRQNAGSRWQVSQRSASGYTVRHPTGL